MFQRIYPAGTAAIPSPPERQALPLDPAQEPEFGLGHPIPAYGQRLIDADQLTEFGKFYTRLQGDDRIILLEGCAKHLPNVEPFEKWAAREPRSAAAQLFAGSAYSHKAWEARGGRLANEVGNAQWSLFHAWLKAASEYLGKAMALDPKDPEPIHRLMRVVMGEDGLHPLTHIQLFQKLKALRPDHLLAHMEVLTQKCEKWGGSHNEMFDFADSVSNAAPDGSLLHTLVPMAIIERMVYYIIEKDTDGANAYLNMPATRDRLAQIYTKTIDSPALQQTPLTPILYNWLAAPLIYSNRHDGRKILLQRMGDRVTERPWAYLGTPVIQLVNGLRADFQLPPL